jgi:hypothetical protein
LGIVWDFSKTLNQGSKSVLGFGIMIIAFLALYFTSSHDSGGRFEAYWSKDPFLHYRKFK